MAQHRKLPSGLPAWLPLLPALAIILAVFVIPIAFVIYASLFDITTLNLAIKAPFIGAGNYVRAATDPELASSLSTTALFMVLTVPVEFGLGLLLAGMVSQLARGRRAFTTILMVPLMTAPIMAGLAILYNFESFGSVAQIYALFGVFPPDFLATNAAIGVVAYADIWQYTPFMFLVLLAGISSLPQSTIEAAMIDGATRWQLWKRVRLPLLKRVILIALLLRLAAVFTMFEYIAIITRGGPLGSLTETVSYYLYRIGFYTDFQIGYVAAASLVVLLVASTIISLVIKRTRIFE